ncbi:cyun147 [Cyclophragma undans nucleopolyhedrovirus]|uniref:Cyun147 n=1 Tax=Cyclophragma undans nucleopolyhedrovirus TaxID=1906244 RepID=A0A288QAE8_9ABAC|nr:cyun147 [Cyclophragma undans nucleopolyhedrovirus]AOT85605.1 cyun147 [Cyclophragma undans nucleopolyhedrovirus]
MLHNKTKMTTQNNNDDDDDNVHTTMSDDDNKIRHIIDGKLYDCVPVYSEEQNVAQEQMSLHIQRKTPQPVYRNYLSLPQGPITFDSPQPLHRIYREESTTRPVVHVQPFAVTETIAAAAAAAAAAEEAAAAAEAAEIIAAEAAQNPISYAAAANIPANLRPFQNPRPFVPYASASNPELFAPNPVFSSAPQRTGLAYFGSAPRRSGLYNLSSRLVSNMSYFDRLRLSLDNRLTSNLITENDVNAILEEQVLLNRITRLEANEIRDALDIE